MRFKENYYQRMEAAIYKDMESATKGRSQGQKSYTKILLFYQFIFNKLIEKEYFCLLFLTLTSALCCKSKREVDYKYLIQIWKEKFPN